MQERVFGIRIKADGAVQVLRDLDKGFDKVNDSSGRVDKSVNQTNQSLKKSETATKRLSDELNKLRSRHLGYAAAAAATATAVTSSIRQFSAYEKSIAEVNTLLSDNQNIDAYSRSVRELSKQFGTSNVQQAQALYSVISAGASDAADATNILTASNKLAIGGVTDIATAADGLTSILNAYNLSSSEAGKVSDILFSTMRAGKTTIGELSANLGKVSPIAAQLGVGLDEVSAAIGTLTTNGVSTSEAVTQVRAALTGILKPTKEASDTASALGINFSTAALESQGLAGFLDTVSIATGGSSEQMAKLFGSTEALQAVMTLAGGSAEKFDEILQKNRDSAGETAVAFGKITEGQTQFNFDQLSADVNALATNFGELLAPATNLAIDALQGVVELADGLVSIVGFIAEGVGKFVVELAKLVGLDDLFGGINDKFNSFNETLADSSSLVGTLAETFTNLDVFRARFIEGALVGWENIKFGASAASEFIELTFNQAFDAVLVAAAAPFEFLQEALQFAGFDDAAANLDGFTESIVGSQNAVEKYESAMSDLRQERDNNIASIKVITGEMVSYALQVDKTGKSVNKLEDDTHDLTDANEDVTQSTLEALDAYTEAANKLLQLSEVTVESTRALFGLDDASQAIQSTLQRVGAASKEQADILARANELYAEGKLSLEELNIVLDEHGEKNREVTSEVEKLWEQTTDSLYDSFEGFFRDGLDGWDDFTDSVEDIFKDMIASLLAQWAASGLIGLFSGEGFSGFSLDNAFGNGSAGSGLGSLLGGLGGGSSDGNGDGLLQQSAESIGLDSAQTENILGGAAAALALYNGFNAIKNGNEVGGSIQVAGGAVDAYNSFQGFTGGQALSGNIAGGVGLAGNLFGVYNGIKQGGLEGYGSAAFNGYQAYQALQTLGIIGQGGQLAANAATLAQTTNLASTFSSASAFANGSASALNLTGAGTAGSQVAGGGTAATGGGGLAAGLGATAAGIGIGLLVDTYLNDGRVQQGFLAELDHTKDFVGNTFKGDFKDPVLSLAEGILISLDKTFGGRSTQELGFDQFSAVVDAQEEGRTQRVDVGNGVTFEGGFNDETVFFTANLLDEQLDKVGEILEKSGLVEDSRGLADGILRLEGDDLNFSENNEEIVQQVKDAIEEVTRTITEADQVFIDSIGGAFEQIGLSADQAFSDLDSAFDAIEDESLSTADRLATAYATAFDTTIEAGNAWVASNEENTDRISQLFETASGEVLTDLLGLTQGAEQNFDAVTAAANDSAFSIQEGYENVLTGLFDRIDVGQIRQPDPVVIDVVQRTQQDNGGQQRSDTDRELGRLIDAVEENTREQKNINPFIQQMAAGGGR